VKAEISLGDGASSFAPGEAGEWRFQGLSTSVPVVSRCGQRGGFALERCTAQKKVMTGDLVVSRMPDKRVGQEIGSRCRDNGLAALPSG